MYVLLLAIAVPQNEKQTVFLADKLEIILGTKTPKLSKSNFHSFVKILRRCREGDFCRRISKYFIC